MSVWLWNQQDRRFEELAEDIASWTLVAADSWFVQDSRVRAFDRHRARFTRVAAQVGMAEAATDDFWAAVLEKIPSTGSGSRVWMSWKLRPDPSVSWHSYCGRRRLRHVSYGF